MVVSEISDAQEYWSIVVRETLNGCYSGRSPLVIPKNTESDGAAPHPSLAEGVLVQHVGELKGQLADWRASLNETDQGFHAVEFIDRYDCHMDAKDPFKDPLGHLIEDSPGTLALVGAVAIVGALGALAYALSRRD